MTMGMHVVAEGEVNFFFVVHGVRNLWLYFFAGFNLAPVPPGDSYLGPQGPDNADLCLCNRVFDLHCT
jgi:hypothetical protein